MAGLLTPPTTPYKGQKQQRRAPLTTVDLNLARPSNHDVRFGFNKTAKPKQISFDEHRTEQPAKAGPSARERSRPEPGWLGEPIFLVPKRSDREESYEPFGEPIFLRKTRTAARPLTPPPEPLPVEWSSALLHSAHGGAGAKVKNLCTKGRAVEAAKDKSLPVTVPLSISKTRVDNPNKTPCSRGAQAKRRKVLSWRATQKLIFQDDDYTTQPSSWQALQDRIFRDDPDDESRARVSSQAARVPVHKKKEPLFLPWDSEDERCKHNKLWSEHKPLWPSHDENKAVHGQVTRQESMLLDDADGHQAAPLPKREPLFLPYSDSEDDMSEQARYIPMHVVPRVSSLFSDVEDETSPAGSNVDNAPTSLDEPADAADEMFGYRAPRCRKMSEQRCEGDVVMHDAVPSTSNKLKRGAVDEAQERERSAPKRRRVQNEPDIAKQARCAHSKKGISRMVASKNASKSTQNVSVAASKKRQVAKRISKDADDGDDGMKGLAPNHPWLKVMRKLAIVSPFY